ncbi:MAG: hypothetical protein OQK82_02680 [Candidatus Pacearchaeota archaeon]|nr:hypothetical protein [Candidatus Pacearchaeota archaeon]
MIDINGTYSRESIREKIKKSFNEIISEHSNNFIFETAKINQDWECLQFYIKNRFGQKEGVAEYAIVVERHSEYLEKKIGEGVLSFDWNANSEDQMQKKIISIIKSQNLSITNTVIHDIQKPGRFFSENYYNYGHDPCD